MQHVLLSQFCSLISITLLILTGFLLPILKGVSLAIKTMHSNVEVIGVEPENVASYAAAIKAGRPVNGFKEATLADGLAVPVVGNHCNIQPSALCILT